MKKIIPIITALGIACTPSTRPVPLNEAGQRPIVEYFHSPSCPHCERTDVIADRLERRFGADILLLRHCIATSHADRYTCRKKYGQDAIGGSNRLRAYGGTFAPTFFVDGKETQNQQVLCTMLGQEPDCLD